MENEEMKTERLNELRELIAKHGYDDSGLARLTLEEREEWVRLGGTEDDLIRNP